MGKIFTDEQITQIQKRCKEFVDCKIHPFDPNSENSREVFAQLIIDDERSTASSIDVCIYTHFFIDYISECVNSPVNNATYQPMLFSYRFESHSVDNIRLKQDLVKYSADNNGWFKTTIINKSNNDFETDSISGLLTLMCGTTYSTRVAISNIQPLNSDDKQIIENITAFVEKLCTKNKTFAAIKAPTPSKEEISYNVDLYKVGYANTAVITHSKNHESLLVDCGIQRTKYHTYSYYSNSEKEIKLINPEYIVISHPFERCPS